MLSDRQPSHLHARRYRAAIAVVIGAWSLLAALTWIPLARLGPGIDEVAHVGAAYRIVTAGDSYLNPEHPPLVKWLAGIAMDIGEDLPDIEPPAEMTRSAAQWHVGREVLRTGDELNRERLTRARLAVLAISAIGLAICTVFAWQLAGRAAGICAALLYATSPTMLAGSTMVLTDLPVGCFALGSTWLVWQWAQSGSIRSCIGAGASASLAALSKYSGLIVVAATLLLVAACGANRREWRSGLMAAAALLAGSVAATALLLIGPIDLESLVDGFGWIGRNHTEGYLFYFFGDSSAEPFVWYFPAALLVKSTIAELIGLTAVLAAPAIATVRAARGEQQVISPLLFLSVFPLAYLAAFMWGAPSSGHRYMMPLYPFAVVAAAVAAASVSSRVGRILAGLVLAAHVAAGISALPDPLSYSNGIAGCRNISLIKCFDDSNIDWGQTLPLAWQEIEPVLSDDDLIVADVVSAMPLNVVLPRSRYIEDAEWENPRPQLYLISAHVLVRRLVYIPGITESLLFKSLDKNCRVGNSHFVVDMRRAATTNTDPTCPLPGGWGNTGQVHRSARDVK